MKAKTTLYAASLLTYVSISLAFITIYGYLKYNLDEVRYANLATGLLIVAIAYNGWAFRKQLKRNKKKSFAYYLTPEWSRRTSAGWEGFFQLDRNLMSLLGAVWLYLPIANGGFNPVFIKITFIVLGLIYAILLAYGSYKFETGKIIYEDRDAPGFWYPAWLQAPGVILSILLAVGAVAILEDPMSKLPEILQGLSAIFIIFFLRQFMPQRWFGPTAVRQAYKKSGKPGYIWGRGWKPPK